MTELAFAAGFLTYPIVVRLLRKATKCVLIYWAGKWGGLSA